MPWRNRGEPFDKPVETPWRNLWRNLLRQLGETNGEISKKPVNPSGEPSGKPREIFGDNQEALQNPLMNQWTPLEELFENLWKHVELAEKPWGNLQRQRRTLGETCGNRGELLEKPVEIAEKPWGK